MPLKRNFWNKELFRYHFKRDPKDWSIDQLHDLWLRASERSKKRQNDVSDYLDLIIKEIPQTDQNNHVVYYNLYHDGKNHGLHSYNIIYSREFLSHSWYTKRVELKTRDEKLEFTLSKSKAFEMGKELHRLIKMRSDKHYVVKHIMWDVIENKLREKFKGSLAPEMFLMKIGSKTYFILNEKDHRYGFYKRFTMGNEFINDCIEI